MALVTHPATAERWPDVESLFGDRGACGGCWCMVWRLTRSEFDTGKGAANRNRLRDLVLADRRPGVVGYLEGNPVAWCAVAPRAEYGFLGRSRVLAPVDDLDVWSVSCLFVDRRFRRRGLSVRMLRAARDFATANGAEIVEGYPIEPASGRLADAFAWTGLLSAYVAAEFREVARRSPTRPIVRYSAAWSRPAPG